MRRYMPWILTIFAAALIIGFIVMTANEKPTTANSQAAIARASTLKEPGDKLQFLLKEARLFIDNKQPEEAIKTCKYVLVSILEDSDEAKDLIILANKELKKSK